MKFAEIVRSSPAVRESFRDLPLLHAWWRVILVLHGKPIDTKRNSHHARTTLAKGFRFYGQLYTSLAIVTSCAVPLIFATEARNQGFWVSLLLGSSLYLGIASALAFSGSDKYLLNHQEARANLVAIFVAVIAYLACFCGVTMAITHYVFPEYDILAMAAFLLFMLLGIGSYLIEILFLVLDTESAETS